MSLNLLSSTTQTVSEALNTLLTRLRLDKWHALDGAIVGIAIWALLRWFGSYRQQLHTTKLRGPQSESFVYGVGKRVLDADDSGAVYEAWAQEYGPVYAVPSTLGNKRIVLCDPKAIAHFYSKETWTYTHTPASKQVLATTVRSFG